jgi:hypothetical protein
VQPGRGAWSTAIATDEQEKQGSIIMNWKTIAQASALVLGLTVAAQAAEVVGTITAISADGLSVTLDDGNTYDFSTAECRDDAGCAIASLQPGNKVLIVYDEEMGKRVGAQISPHQ